MAKRHKYSAKPCVIDGVRFASQAEGARYLDLRLREKAGAIVRLELQPRFALVVCAESNGEAIRVCDYVADFRYYEAEVDEGGFSGRWRLVIEDVKGMKTPMYRLKKKMLTAQYGIEIREIGRAARRNQPVAKLGRPRRAKPKPRAVAYQEHAK